MRRTVSRHEKDTETFTLAVATSNGHETELKCEVVVAWSTPLWMKCCSHPRICRPSSSQKYRLFEEEEVATVASGLCSGDYVRITVVNGGDLGCDRLMVDVKGEQSLFDIEDGMLYIRSHHSRIATVDEGSLAITVSLMQDLSAIEVQEILKLTSLRCSPRTALRWRKAEVEVVRVSEKGDGSTAEQRLFFTRLAFRVCAPLMVQTSRRPKHVLVKTAQRLNGLAISQSLLAERPVTCSLKLSIKSASSDVRISVDEPFSMAPFSGGTHLMYKPPTGGASHVVGTVDGCTHPSAPEQDSIQTTLTANSGVHGGVALLAHTFLQSISLVLGECGIKVVTVSVEDVPNCVGDCCSCEYVGSVAASKDTPTLVVPDASLKYTQGSLMV